MTWNWQKADWPHFTYDTQALQQAEADFLLAAGVMVGAFVHLRPENKNQLTVELISTEALKTSEIEGELLDRDSVQSSVQRQLGLTPEGIVGRPQEQGIAEMLVDLYHSFDALLSHATLFRWHRQLCAGRQDIQTIGGYRTHQDPMQVVSGAVYAPKVHFEAPPSSQVPDEMEQFLRWFNDSSKLPALTRAGIAHLYFVSIHPFEDGNGRIARALSEKSLAQSIGQPSRITLARTIEKHRKDYYHALEKANQDNEITDWLVYFAQTVLRAQQDTLSYVEFIIEKTKLYDRVSKQLNERQAKVLERMFRAGMEGFQGGLSADNYLKITGTSRATATRDLHQLVEMGALYSIGHLKSTRYHLNIGKNRRH
jgi:Fic family protein